MLDHAALTPEALSYFQSLPLSYQVAMNHSNLTFRTDIQNLILLVLDRQFHRFLLSIRKFTQFTGKSIS